MGGPTVLIPLATITASRISIIGRVRPLDPGLGVMWFHSMTIYGDWFDDIAKDDPTLGLRKKVASASREMNPTQLRRDDQYCTDW